MRRPDPETYHIIGMSPGNSYFKDDEVRYLLKTVVDRFGRVAILIADVPAIATYVAFGYPENRARRDKAIPQGNALKNRVRKAMQDLGYTAEQVRIVDWADEIEQNGNYQAEYKKIRALYDENESFRDAANSTTRAVLEGSRHTFTDIQSATQTAVHYLLSEFAFLEFAPRFLSAKKVVYVYHKNWHVYEDYIAGMFDKTLKPHLDFLLLENPYETYNPIWGLEDTENGEYRDALDRVEKTKLLRVGFTNSIPTFVYDRDYDNFSGIFYDLIIEIAKRHGWQVRWSEEIGYGVIVDGLDNNRFDIFGSTVWPTPERIKQADFSRSLFKSPVFAWIRADHDVTPESVKNDVTLRVAIKENDISDSIAQSDFSQHRQVRVPQLSDNAEGLKFVAEGRADFTFVEEYLGNHFNEISAVKVRKISDDPIRVYDNTFMLKRGEARLKELLDTDLTILIENGVVRRLVKKYTGSEDTFSY